MAAGTLSNSLKSARPLRSIEIPGDPSIPTRHRWALTGIVAPDGHRVRLQTWRVGGKLMTTPEAVERFILALSGDAPAVEADDAIARRGEQAARALEKLGC
ncbi:MAG: DUF1580 domain-containing protein [Planctomycetaceae bacterium]|nr:DUF1580 domain-containing protein [Planctomycetaceae bacterium]